MFCAILELKGVVNLKSTSADMTTYSTSLCSTRKGTIDRHKHLAYLN